MLVQHFFVGNNRLQKNRKFEKIDFKLSILCTTLKGYNNFNFGKFVLVTNRRLSHQFFYHH